MQRYDPGDTASLRREVRDPDSGALLDATVVFEYLPAGETVWVSGSVTHNGTGIYDAIIAEVTDGLWQYRWTTSGAIADVTKGRFYVADEGDELPPLAPFERLAAKLGGTVEDFDDVEFDRGCAL